MKVSVEWKGIDAVQARLRGLADKKLKAAAVSALNDAARAGADAAKREMSRVFDKPTPWVLGGVRYVKARADKLESSIDFDHWGNKTGVTVGHVLNAEIYGGQRRHKRHEVALQRAGILPNGLGIVPGVGADTDAYGNMKGGQIVQILAYFRAFGEQGYRANMDSRGRAKLARGTKKSVYGLAYFVLYRRHGKLLPGIYKRTKTGFGYAVKPVMIFVRLPSYRKRFDFYGVAERAARDQFDRSFKQYLVQMLAERGL